MAIRFWGVFGHQQRDVRFWNQLPWPEYNQLWIPDNTQECPTNEVIHPKGE